MLTVFVLAAMLAAPSEPMTVPEVQKRIEGHLQTFQDKLVYVHTLLKGGAESAFENSLREPDTGMSIKSMPSPDASGLHPLEILTVFPGDPAEEAGIKPGDRIGKAPNPLSMTILREQNELHVSVNQRPLHCMERAIAQFDRTKWLQQIELLQQQTTKLQDALKQYPDNIELLRETVRELKGMDLLIPIVLDNMSRDLVSFI
jgi:exonuclease VII small subunit